MQYDLEVQELEESLLVQGWLRLTLDCQCVRCLKSVHPVLEIDPWSCHLPLEGEDAVVVNNDCVDLTPLVREDILLEFPRHPLCDPECRGLPKEYFGKATETSSPAGNETVPGSPAWNELNK